MSNGFWYFPSEKKYFSTAINHNLQKELELALCQSLPCNLYDCDIKALEHVRNNVLSYSISAEKDQKAIDEIIEAINHFGSVQLGRCGSFD